MEKLTVKGIKDYKTCARLYDYRYLDREFEPMYYRELLRKKYNTTLSRVLYFYFYKKMGGHVPSFNALLNRWEKMWFKNVDLYDIQTESLNPQVDTPVSLNTDATAVLMRFYEYWEEDEGIPISIANNIITPINDEVFVEDVLDLVIRYKKKDGHKYNVLKFYTDTTKPNTANHILDFANLRANFEHRNEEKLGRHDTVEYLLYDLGSGKRDARIAEMIVQDEDIKDMQYWALQIHNDKVFPSRRGLTIACKTCPFDEPCAKWDDWYGKNRIQRTV